VQDRALPSPGAVRRPGAPSLASRLRGRRWRPADTAASAGWS